MARITLKKRKSNRAIQFRYRSGEKNNLAGIKPDIAFEMRSKLNEWIIKVNAKMPTINKKLKKNGIPEIVNEKLR